MLPDSGANFTRSQGFISYKIKPKQPVQLLENITNRAAIFFDMNIPVLTNKTSTTFVNNVGIKENNLTFDFALYPNPTNDFIILEFDKAKDANELSLLITDQLGRPVSKSIHTSESKIKIAVAKLTSGIYFITATSKSGVRSTKKLVKY